MSSQGGPTIFCSRPDGSLTPLLALDDLPDYVSVRGVRRTLKPAETQGIISCGSTEPRSEPWDLEGDNVATPGAIADNAELHAVLLKIVSETTVAPHLRQAVKDILVRDLAAPRPAGAAVNGNTNNNTGRNAGNGHGAHASAKHGYNTKKEYCSYWIRHGECDYAQQGCLFKHQMPTDLAMLEKLGLRDIPRWYREQHGVPSLLATNGNHNRGHLAAPEQPPNYQAVANNGITAGTAGHAGFAGVHANGHAGPADHARPSGQVGPSGHANPNATNKNRNGNQHGHGHGHGNNNNGPNNGHGHPRGGRYKSPRGAGFAAGKTRGTWNWSKAVVRDNVTPPPEDKGNVSTGTPSSRTSGDSGVSYRNGAKLDLMADPTVSPLAEAENASQHILDKDDMGTKTLVARLQELSPKNAFGGLHNDTDQPDMSRTESYPPYQFGLDGFKTEGHSFDGVKTKGTGFDPYTGLKNLEAGIKASAGAKTSLLSQLVAASEPIKPNEPLINWGPIGEPVQGPTATNDNIYTWIAFHNGVRNVLSRDVAHFN